MRTGAGEKMDKKVLIADQINEKGIEELKGVAEVVNNFTISKEELLEYAKGKDQMNVIEFEKFEKFKKPVKPDRFVTVSGKYIYEDEFDMITKNKD